MIKIISNNKLLIFLISFVTLFYLGTASLSNAVIIVDKQKSSSSSSSSPSSSGANKAQKIDFIKTKGPVVTKVSSQKALAQKQQLALSHLIALLKKNAKFQADLSQRNLTQDGEVKSSGIIKIEQPNNFYYEIKNPNQVIYISDGTTLWQYDKSLMQVIKKKIDIGVASSKIPLLILTNPSKNLLKYFSIKEMQPNIFILTNLTKGDFIHLVLIGFDNDKSSKINQFQIVNTLNQKTEILFSNVRIVKSFKAGIFDFKAPKGVDVLA